MIPLLWIDTETTGLDPMNDLVLELEARLTDASLNVTDTFHVVISYPEDSYALVNMANKVRAFHVQNGLLQEVRDSKVSLDVARKSLANWLYSKFTLGEKRPIAGSNPTFDRRFMEVHFASCVDFLHYRSLDMNSVYYFMEIDKDRKKGTQKHRTSADLDWDINMLRQLKGRIR